LRRLFASTLEVNHLRTLDFEGLPGRSSAFVRLGASRASALYAQESEFVRRGVYSAKSGEGKALATISGRREAM
jgi:hypothetical protein